jgi:hypothetical protein
MENTISSHNIFREKYLIMKRVLLCYILLLALSVSSCGTPAVQTTPDGLSIQNTATTKIQVVPPTNTNIPPTNIITSTPQATDTLIPSPTIDASATPTETLMPTDTPQPVAAGPCSQQLASWSGSTSNFVAMNETDNQKANIQLIASVTTKTGECGWLNINGSSFSGPAGKYKVTAFVSGMPRISGAFFIQGGDWKIVVRNTGIVALGGCYPHC